MNYSETEYQNVINWLKENRFAYYNKTDITSLMRVHRKFRLLENNSHHPECVSCRESKVISNGYCNICGSSQNGA